MSSLKNILSVLLLALILGCKSEVKETVSEEIPEGEEIAIDYASGFELTDYGHYSILRVKDPWPESEKTFRYLLTKKNAEVPENLLYDQRIEIPVEKIIVTSTTHIPSLEILGEEEHLIGFPGLVHISSEKTRQRISEGKIREIGKNEALNTEIILDLKPDLLVGFSVDGSNRTFNTISKSGIPVVYNSDWTEKSPLGKAEWIKFFGAFFDKNQEAAEFFNEVAAAYQEAKEIATTSISTPSVLSGSMYKDQWFLPTGDSWHAQFIKDANAEYTYAETSGSGSLSLAFESVLAKAKDAEYWIGPAEFQSYQEMQSASDHYTQFRAFQKKQIFTYSSEKGETGGVLFFEMAPNRPDLVLKDLISIFHPELLPEYSTTFYKPLQ